MHGQLSNVIIPVLAGACAWVYSARLTDAGMILNWWYLFCDQYLPNWIAKPLCTCYKCVAGQWGLWSYILIAWPGTFDRMLIVEFLAAPSISIITSLILNRYVGNGEAQND